jgi:hypothetical protein
MIQSSPSRVITMLDIGLSANEFYVQFVPPATFGVILDRSGSSHERISLVRANGERTVLRRSADKIYALRGFIGLRRREVRRLELGWDVEDEIIRIILESFGCLERLRGAVWKHCPCFENAEIINETWGTVVLEAEDKGLSVVVADA